MYNRYTAHPKHILYPIFFLGLGTAAFNFDGWVMFGVTVYLFSFLIGVWIVYAGIVRERTEYWEVITNTARQLDRTSNPEIWKALGFTVPSNEVKIIADVTTHENKKAGVKNIKFETAPVSPAKLYTFAQGVLNGASLSYGKWSGKKKLFTDPEYREFHKFMRAQKWIERTNSEEGRQGYKLTDYGESVLNETVDSTVHHVAPILPNKITTPLLNASPARET